MNSTCPIEDQPDYCNFVIANPDISVRISVYVQVGLNVLASTLFQSNLQLTRDTARTSYVLSFSLVLASIVQWKLEGLALFDALVGTQISSLGLSINISSTLFLLLYTYWGIQTWSFPPCPSHTLTQFVLFGKSIPATRLGLRIFALIVFGCVGIVSLVALGLLCTWGIKVWVYGGEVNARSREVWMNHKRERYGIGAGAGTSRLTSLVPLAIFLYLVVSTEQLVARNKAEHGLANLDEWTYGQTLAVIMLFTQLVELGLWVWRDKRQRRELEWRGRSARNA
ncbi:transmembrane protein, putative [Rhizoctonia solani AG-3 Rhs1AP]|uniref:Transmembrane protein, putative n=2 Tax=Rhizoctonia solani AG-3 TaxID=1086053 RepID=X8JIP7_9AGAM|nr:transmembrane protein, putative [Rhizoctonia solani AG-3 Rhs1AP]KEP47636.1 putative transmembrane protein [Rhizoctonia solani 123E]